MSEYFLTKYGISLPLIKKLDGSAIIHDEIYDFKPDNNLIENNITLDYLNLYCNYINNFRLINNLNPIFTTFNKSNNRKITIKSEIDYSVKLEIILKEILLTNETISIVKLKNLLLDYDYPLERLNNDLASLKNKEVIKYSTSGISYIYPDLNYYINNKIKENRQLVLEDKFSNLSLIDIINKLDFSIEQIREITLREATNFPTIIEHKYSGIFEEYNWNKEVLINFLGIDDQTYDYLDKNYVKGNNEVYKLFENYLPAKEYNYLKNIIKIRNIFKEKTFIDKYEVLRVIVQFFAHNKINLNQLYRIYNDFRELNLLEYNLEVVDFKTFKTLLYDLNIVLFTSKNIVRYFNFKKLTGYKIAQLKETLNITEGYYSTKIIFESNKFLMENLEIIDEYELYHLLEKLFSNHLKTIKFIKSPEIVIGNTNQEKFILKKIKELAPISINDFIQSLKNTYGLKPNGMNIYLNKKFKEYIKDKYLHIDIKLFSESDLIKVKDYFIKDVYSYNDIKNLLTKLGYDYSYFNYPNFKKLGYELKGEYIIKDSYPSVTKYLNYYARNNDFLKLNKDYYDIPIFNLSLTKLANSFEIIKISDNEYTTYRKLKSLGITKKILNDTRDQIINLLNDNKYISLKHIKTIIDKTILNDFGFEDIFYEELTSTITNIRKIKINNYPVFTFSKSIISDFIEDIYPTDKLLTINQLEKLLKEQFDIYVDYNKLKYYINNTNLYYDEGMEKIYLDKNDYYKEVFGNEKE